MSTEATEEEGCPSCFLPVRSHYRFLSLGGRRKVVMPGRNARNNVLAHSLRTSFCFWPLGWLRGSGLRLSLLCSNVKELGQQRQNPAFRSSGLCSPVSSASRQLPDPGGGNSLPAQFRFRWREIGHDNANSQNPSEDPM